MVIITVALTFFCFVLLQSHGRNPGGESEHGESENALEKSKAKAQAARAKQTAAPRAQSQGAQILPLMGRPKGATLAEIREDRGVAGAQRARLPVQRGQET
jgi:hypothetical protein